MNAKRKNKPSDQPLRVEVKNGVLSISIGVSTLAFGLEHNNEFLTYDAEPMWKVTGDGGFAMDVKAELTREAEDGTMPIHILLDEAMQNAIEQGSAHVAETKAAKLARRLQELEDATRNK
jgi:thiamine pyrophosphate-dependent acetolactate synthase large subunit-like protein